MIGGSTITSAGAAVGAGTGSGIRAAAGQTIYGKVLTQQNTPLQSTVVTLSQNGRALGSQTTSSDGSYAFNAPAGAYSLKYVPPTAGYATLNAFDVVAPFGSALNVMLTVPTPGRSFVTGTVALNNGVKLEKSSYIQVGDLGSSYLDDNGGFRMMPTAGTSSPYLIKGFQRGGDFRFQLKGTSSATINQDVQANFLISATTQRVRVVDTQGNPIANAQVYGGIPGNSTVLPTTPAIEGLGSFTASTYDSQFTDSNGWVTLNSIATTAAANGSLTVSPPSGSRFQPQDFTKPFGAGPVTLTLVNPNVLITGSVKDSTGAAVPGIQLSFSPTWTTTGANGGYMMSVPPGTSSTLSVTDKSNWGSNVGSLASFTSAGPIVASADKTLNLVIPYTQTKVRVLDAKGLPVSNAWVDLSNAAANSGKVTMAQGMAAFSGGIEAAGYTDSSGVVSLKTAKLDSEVVGTATVQPPSTSSYAVEILPTRVGLGNAITLTLQKPTVKVSGTFTYTDGTKIDGGSVSFQNGDGLNGGAVNTDSTGAYSMPVLKGMTAFFTASCPFNANRDVYPLCVSFVSANHTINADTTVNLTIPTFKVPVRVVDPSGKGIANVKVAFNAGPGGMIPCDAKATVIAGDAPVSISWSGIATTDSTGLAMVPNVRPNAVCSAYVYLTPDANSRYQERYVQLNVGDNASNVVVLSIPAPVITSATVTKTGTTTSVNLLGDNFAGTTDVTLGTTAITNFKVVDKQHITFVVPAGVSGTVVTVKNGGGS
ncbi:MAG: hypothetical protein RJA35_1064, partial [Actinomycetota bacterium]